MSDFENLCFEEAPLSLSEQKRKMMRSLMEEGISERLAKAAVQHCSLPLNYDDCVMEALELEPTEYDADDEINVLVREFDKEVGEFADITTAHFEID